MIPSTVPSGEFTPFLLKQTGLRASLLHTSFGFAIDDWDDLRQVLALDCLTRLPRFDASRGDWKGFVRGVVRNRACVIASRHVRRPELQSLETGAAGECDSADGPFDAPCADFGAELGLRLDVQRVLAGLPADLQTLARYLAEMPFSRVRQKTGLSLSQLNRRIMRIRAAFVAAGIAPQAFVATRGAR